MSTDKDEESRGRASLVAFRNPKNFQCGGGVQELSDKGEGDKDNEEEMEDAVGMSRTTANDDDCRGCKTKEGKANAVVVVGE